MIPERKNHVLCTNLDAIRDLALKLMGKTSTETHDLASRIYAAVTVSKKQALPMEKRLYLYKETIEGLGFERKRRRTK